MIPLDGPFYDRLNPGDELPRQPAVTVDTGMAALYQSMVGERLALVLDAPLCRAVTGSDRRLVSPGLLMQLSIGQSTTVSRRAIANLFYRGIRLSSQVFMDDTVATTVSVAAMSDASARPDRPPRGKVLVDIETTASDPEGAVRTAIAYQRCPMLPLDGIELPGHSSDLGSVPDLDLASYAELVPDWNLEPLGPSVPWAVGETIVDPTRDVVDTATGMVRLTHNLAMIHRDTQASPYDRRLVYGGHVVGLAQASLSRVVPGLATVLGWQSCNHLGPAFEDDLLAFDHTLVGSMDVGGGRVLAVQVIGAALRPGADDGGASEEGLTPAIILDWTVIVLAPAA